MDSKSYLRNIIREALNLESNGKGMFHNFAQFNDSKYASITGSELNSDNKSDEKVDSNIKDVWSKSLSFENKEDLNKKIDEYKKYLFSIKDEGGSSYEKFIEKHFKTFLKIFNEALSYYNMNGSHKKELIDSLNKWSKILSDFLNKNAKEVRNDEMKKFLGI
jgi:hypothetical protein